MRSLLNFSTIHTHAYVHELTATVCFYLFFSSLFYLYAASNQLRCMCFFLCFVCSSPYFPFSLLHCLCCVHVSTNFVLCFFYLNIFGSLNWKSLSRKSMSSDAIVCECDCCDNLIKFSYTRKWYIALFSFFIVWQTIARSNDI